MATTNFSYKFTNLTNLRIITCSRHKKISVNQLNQSNQCSKKSRNSLKYLFIYPSVLGNLSGEWLTWHYFGFSYTFGLIVAVAQIGGSILLLFRKTRLLGVILLLPVLLNILFINLFYGLNAGATLQSIVLSLGLIYLFSLNFKRILSFLFDIKDGLKNGELWGRGVQNLIRFATVFIPKVSILLKKNNHLTIILSFIARQNGLKMM